MDTRRHIASIVLVLTVAACAPYPVVTIVPSSAYEATVVYRDGYPTVLVDGSYVFVEFDPILGWGYHDRSNRWFGVAPRFHADLNRRYPEGTGLMRSPYIAHDKPPVMTRTPVVRHPEPGDRTVSPSAHIFAKPPHGEPVCGEHAAARC